MSFAWGELRRLRGDHEELVGEVLDVDLEGQTLRPTKLDYRMELLLRGGEPQPARLYLPCEASEPCEMRCVAAIEILPPRDRLADILDADLGFAITVNQGET